MNLFRTPNLQFLDDEPVVGGAESDEEPDLVLAPGKVKVDRADEGAAEGPLRGERVPRDVRDLPLDVHQPVQEYLRVEGQLKNRIG